MVGEDLEIPNIWLIEKLQNTSHTHSNIMLVQVLRSAISTIG